MLENEVGVIQEQLPSPVKTRNKRKVPGHDKRRRPKYCGEWDHANGNWKKTKTD